MREAAKGVKGRDIPAGGWRAQSARGGDRCAKCMRNAKSIIGETSGKTLYFGLRVFPDARKKHMTTTTITLQGSPRTHIPRLAQPIGRGMWVRGLPCSVMVVVVMCFFLASGKIGRAHV